MSNDNSGRFDDDENLFDGDEDGAELPSGEPAGDSSRFDEEFGHQQEDPAGEPSRPEGSVEDENPFDDTDEAIESLANGTAPGESRHAHESDEVGHDSDPASRDDRVEGGSGDLDESMFAPSREDDDDPFHAEAEASAGDWEDDPDHVDHTADVGPDGFELEGESEEHATSGSASGLDGIKGKIRDTSRVKLLAIGGGGVFVVLLLLMLLSGGGGDQSGGTDTPSVAELEAEYQERQAEGQGNGSTAADDRASSGTVPAQNNGSGQGADSRSDPDEQAPDSSPFAAAAEEEDSVGQEGGDVIDSPDALQAAIRQQVEGRLAPVREQMAGRIQQVDNRVKTASRRLSGVADAQSSLEQRVASLEARLTEMLAEESSSSASNGSASGSGSEGASEPAARPSAKPPKYVLDDYRISEMDGGAARVTMSIERRDDAAPLSSDDISVRIERRDDTGFYTHVDVPDSIIKDRAPEPRGFLTRAANVIHDGFRRFRYEANAPMAVDLMVRDGQLDLVLAPKSQIEAASRRDGFGVRRNPDTRRIEYAGTGESVRSRISRTGSSGLMGSNAAERTGAQRASASRQARPAPSRVNDANVVETWSLVAMTNRMAIIVHSRSAQRMTVMENTKVPGVGRVTLLDPIAREVHTSDGVIVAHR